MPAAALYIGVTAAASYPNNLIDDTILRLFELRDINILNHISASNCWVRLRKIVVGRPVPRALPDRHGDAGSETMEKRIRDILTGAGGGFRVAARSVRALRELVYNLWWTWNPQARRLFSQIDPALWAMYRNPIEVLINIEEQHWEWSSRTKCS